jgi:hypothetical protein
MPRRRAQALDGAPVARKKPGPKPGFKREASAAVLEPSVPPFEQRVLNDGARPNAFRTGVNLDTLAGPELRAYALQIGLTQRDAEGLGEDRLRMNCKARLFDMIETFLE